MVNREVSDGDDVGEALSLPLRRSRLGSLSEVLQSAANLSKL